MGSKTKIVALCGISRNAGGVFYAVSSLCKELQVQGVGISVMGDARSLTDEDRTVWESVPLMPYRAIGPLGSGIGLRRNLVQSEAGLVHQHGLWLDDQWSSLHWQRKTGRPVVISPHGMLDPWAVQNSAWKKKLAGALFANESLRKSACIHALCQSEADSIRKYGLNNPIAVIPNGVELPSLTPDPCPPTSGGKRKLLFLGRIHPKKGLSELLKGWAKAQSLKPNAFPDWQLLIAGWDDGGHLLSLKRLADELGLSWTDGMPETEAELNSLVFLGPVFGNDKEALLRGVDGFILPSFSEGLPMSVLEAWSYGLPVMMTEFCNIPEGFEADAAIKIEPNVESITCGLNLWMEMEEDERMAMGGHGRLLVERNFTWKKIAQNMKTVYENCVFGK